MHIKISISAQELTVWQESTLLATYPCSTSAFGHGNEENSLKTPLGAFRIAEKIGTDAPMGTIFRHRCPTGKIWAAGEIPSTYAEGEDDLVLSRILWLEGVEPHNANTKERCIYIHGTNDEVGIGQPRSHGCIRLRNVDVMSLFAMIDVGTAVECTD